MKSNVPNLDATWQDDLRLFWKHHQNGRHYLELFPDGALGTKRTTADLANYAHNKATAMGCRLRGDVNTALMYEGVCDRIYLSLPDAARW